MRWLISCENYGIKMSIMATFPLVLTAVLGKPLAYLVFLLIGFGFGYVLESSGFAYSPKLAAQFYFTDLTVLKVMFTGIIVAMVLIFWVNSLRLVGFPINMGQPYLFMAWDCRWIDHGGRFYHRWFLSWDFAHSDGYSQIRWNLLCIGRVFRHFCIWRNS